MEDNWQHRSRMMACATCMWFVPKTPTAAPQPADKPIPYTVEPQGRLGRCRRHAPTLGGWPAVFETDWCGDHKLDHNKV